MNEIKYWSLGGRMFINFFGEVVIPVDQIALIVFNERTDGFGGTMKKTPVALVWDIEGSKVSPDGEEGAWVFEGELRDKLFAFCSDDQR